MNQKTKHLLLKKLLYQSCHRGCKETDLILGKFAKENLYKMQNEELEAFANILNINDADIYDWYTQKKPIPQKIASKLMLQILDFIPYQ